MIAHSLDLVDNRGDSLELALAVRAEQFLSKLHASLIAPCFITYARREALLPAASYYASGSIRP